MSAGIGVIAAFITTRASWGLWVALAGMVIFGAILQGYVTVHEKTAVLCAAATGSGAVAVRGSAVKVQTFASGSDGTAERPGTTEGAEISATGPGSVSIGGDAGEITTRVTRGKDP
jgi:hypothetical protein